MDAIIDAPTRCAVPGNGQDKANHLTALTRINPDDLRMSPSARTNRAALMARTLGFDVLACPRCGGRLRLIALIEEARD